MLAGYSFRPRAWALALAAAGCAAGVALGNWQSRRAEEKRVLAERIEQALRAPPIELPSAPVDPSKFSWQRVTARGEFVPEHTVLLDNKVHRGQVGYEVLTAFRILKSRLHVLVNRGWIAAGRTRDALPEIRTPRGELRIEGLALERLPQALETRPAPAGKVQQNLRLEDFAAQTGLALQPIFIRQQSGPDDGLVRDWPPPDTGIERHQAYALQWYSLAALVVVLAVVLSFRRIEDPSK